jgi:hypothetical protein
MPRRHWRGIAFSLARTGPYRQVKQSQAFTIQTALVELCRLPIFTEIEK